MAVKLSKPKSRAGQKLARRLRSPAGKFDPITIEILWRRLVSIVDEADAAVARTAFSSVLRDAHEYTCMVTERQGRELAQGTFATSAETGCLPACTKNS